MSVNSSRRVDMYAFVWEYRLGRGCARTAQLNNSLAAWRGCALSLERASPANRGQPLQKVPVMAGCPNHSSLFVIGRSIHSHQSRRTRHALVTGMRW
jgi:hypothetical protein